MKIPNALAIVALWMAAANMAHAADAGEGIRLYAVDCGTLSFKDMSMFSDTGKYDGKTGSIIDPCFVIRHPSGVLVWDTGLGDSLAGKQVPANADGVTLHVREKLVDQLAKINLKPADVTFVAFSHFHLDHTGNANLFGSATWILNEAELAWALGKPTPPVVGVDSISGYRTAKTRLISGDYDVFGDGTVRILKAPGHTPGHQVLLLKLAHAGPVLLSGDLYHMRSDRPAPGSNDPQVMTTNIDRAESLASSKPHREHSQEHESTLGDSTRSRRFRRFAEIPGLSGLMTAA